MNLFQANEICQQPQVYPGVVVERFRDGDPPLPLWYCLKNCRRNKTDAGALQPAVSLEEPCLTIPQDRGRCSCEESGRVSLVLVTQARSRTFLINPVQLWPSQSQREPCPSKVSYPKDTKVAWPAAGH